MIQRNVRDTVLLSGWLFADLFLGLVVIFMASVLGAQPRPPIIPTLTVTPTVLSSTYSGCSGGTEQPQCTLTVGETPASLGNVTWTASSDISDAITFSPSSGTLSPGKDTTVVVSVLPCQNGSLTFSGSRGASPVIVSWHCTPTPKPPDRLDFTYRQFSLRVNDVNGLLNNSSAEVDNIKNQVIRQPVLQGRRVGLVIAYAGALTDGDIQTALAIAQKVYGIFKELGGRFPPVQNTSYYEPLFVLGGNPNVVKVHVYLFEQ